MLNQQDVNSILDSEDHSTEWSDINPQEELDKYFNDSTQNYHSFWNSSSQQMEVIQKDSLRRNFTKDSLNKPKARNVTKGETNWQWTRYIPTFPLLMFAAITFFLFLVFNLCVPETIILAQFLSLLYSLLFGCLITLMS